MTLDSWLVGRLAREIDAALAGARVEDVTAGASDIAIACYRRGDRMVLHASLDPERPLAALVPDGSITRESGPGGWVAGAAPLLRGSVVDAVQAVPHDRILNVDVSSRSAFGVPARHRITLELEQRKVNGLILRPGHPDEWLILAAARRFDGRGGAREIAIGQSYTPPPPRPRKRDRTMFVDAVRDAIAEAPQSPSARVLARLLGEFDPTCTPPLAREIVDRALAQFDEHTQARFAEELLSDWSALRATVEELVQDIHAPVHSYQLGDEITACHVVPLHWPSGEHHLAAGINDVCSRAVLNEQRRPAPEGSALRRKLERMLGRGAEQAVQLTAARERARAAEELRIAGDAIYANLISIEPRSSSFETPDGARIALDPTLSAKQNAAAYFRRYKKAHSGMPLIEARLQTLALNRRYWEELIWELDRADAQPALRAEIYADVAAAINTPKRANHAGKRRAGRLQPRRAKTNAIDLADGARAFVGRSPKDNERLTFAFASPDDYWFHARGIPGAHVILKLAHAGATPTAEQIEASAALAAGASRAADAVKVEVDYTRRKYVRRQGKGGTGLVWYTDAKTILVAPKVI